MKRSLLILAVVAATACLGWRVMAADPPAVQPVPAAAPNLPEGFTPKDAKDADDIRAAVCDVINSAMTKDELNKLLVDGLAGASPKRMALDVKAADLQKLNARLDQVRQAFKTKYGLDFDITKELRSRVFTAQDVVVQGEVKLPIIATANWPVTAGSPEAAKAGAMAAPLPAEQEKTAERQEKLGKGVDVALLQMSARPEQSAIIVSLVHPIPLLTPWQVDVSADRTSQDICNDLTAHLTYLGDHSDQWPTDFVDAYRLFSHHVLAALYGVD